MIKRQTKRYDNKRFFRTVWFMMIFLISGLLARYALIGLNDMLGLHKDVHSVQVEIPEGASLKQVAKIFKSNGLITEKQLFKIYAVATKNSKNFLAGSYELYTNMDYQALLNHIKNKSNIKDTEVLTFTEGMNILDYAELLSKNHVCSKQEFLEICNSSEFDGDYNFLASANQNKNIVYRTEGYLFPDTYKFYRGEKPSSVVNKMLNNYSKKISQKGAIEKYRSSTINEMILSSGMSMNQIICIASLIQAEAANKADMYKVSSVIHNRLNTIQNGGKNKFNEFAMNYLQIDSTIYYPYKTKSSVPKNLASTFKSAYDTYKAPALPPGPICNPGVDAIDAALNPAKTDYFYYCHSASGEAFYAKNSDEHLANLKKAGLTIKKQ